MQAVGTWGHVAAAFAGAAVGASIGGSHHHHEYYSSSDDYSPPSSNDFDVSNVIDDAGDIGGGSWGDD